MTTPVQIYDRIYIKNNKRPNLVIEYLDGYCNVRQDWLDEWRLIDLDTGEVFESSPVLNEVIHVAANMSDIDDPQAYQTGWKDLK